MRNNTTNTAYKIPSRKSSHFLHQPFVPVFFDSDGAFLIVPVAVHAHDGECDQRYACHQRAVDNQLVVGGIDTGEGDRQFQQGFQYPHNGIVFHVLVGVHRRVVWDGHYRKHGADNERAVHHLGGKRALLRDVEYAVEEEISGNH